MLGESTYAYSITLRTDALEVLFSLRGLAVWAQHSGNPYRSVRGTSCEDWLGNQHQVAFKFSDSAYRDDFESAVVRVFAPGLVEIISEGDAAPQQNRFAS